MEKEINSIFDTAYQGLGLPTTVKKINVKIADAYKLKEVVEEYEFERSDVFVAVTENFYLVKHSGVFYLFSQKVSKIPLSTFSLYDRHEIETKIKNIVGRNDFDKKISKNLSPVSVKEYKITEINKTKRFTSFVYDNIDSIDVNTILERYDTDNNIVTVKYNRGVAKFPFIELGTVYYKLIKKERTQVKSIRSKMLQGELLELISTIQFAKEKRIKKSAEIYCFAKKAAIRIMDYSGIDGTGYFLSSHVNKDYELRTVTIKDTDYSEKVSEELSKLYKVTVLKAMGFNSPKKKTAAELLRYLIGLAYNSDIYNIYAFNKFILSKI